MTRYHGAGGADRRAQDGPKHGVYLAGGHLQDKACQDHAVNVRSPANLGTHHRDRVQAPGAADAKLDVVAPGEQVAE